MINGNLAQVVFERTAKALRYERLSFREFIRHAWPIIEPANPYMHNWHIDAMAEHLEAVNLGQIKRLAINMPPRYGKSNLVSILWPSWTWTVEPWERFLFVSYSDDLAVEHSVNRRALLESVWFQQRWGNQVQFTADQNMKGAYKNTQSGSMVSAGIGGTITGKGGNRIVIDDPVDPRRAFSTAMREAANGYYGQTLSTRLDNKKTGAIVIVMQRLHRNDLTGHVLANGEGYTCLTLPAITEDSSVVYFPLSKKEIVRPAGDVLWPQRENAEDLKRQEKAMGTRAFGGQYNQSPTSDEGAILKRSWWRYYRQLPVLGTGNGDAAHHRIWVWDTAAKDKERDDYTAGFCLATTPTGVYVVRHVKERVQYPELRRLIEQEFNGLPARAVVIEDKSSGQSVIQDLRRSTRLPIIAFEVGSRDKVERANLVAPTLESGRVHLPETAPWVAGFVENAAAFPDVEHDDDVDAFVEGLLYLNGAGCPPEPGVWAMSGGDAGRSADPGDDLDDDD
jgi:predicted phage terminase large subunit-like protein